MTITCSSCENILLIDLCGPALPLNLVLNRSLVHQTVLHACRIRLHTIDSCGLAPCLLRELSAADCLAKMQTKDTYNRLLWYGPVLVPCSLWELQHRTVLHKCRIRLRTINSCSLALSGLCALWELSALHSITNDG